MDNISTKELSKGLSERKGVQQINLEPYAECQIKTDQIKHTLTGPAIILINQD
jgi:hypothetical protein